MAESKRFVYVYSTGEITKGVDLGTSKYADNITLEELAKYIFYGELYYIKKWKETIPPLKLKKQGEIVIMREKYDLYDKYDKPGAKNDEKEDVKYPHNLKGIQKTFQGKINKLKEKASKINI